MGGGVGAAVHDTASAGSAGSGGSASVPKVVFRLYETLTLENRILKVVVTLRRFLPDMPEPMCFHRERKGQKREGFIIARHSATVWT